MRIKKTTFSKQLTFKQWVIFGIVFVSSCILYFWKATSQGWLNGFYSAAVQAGTQNWEAFFWGSSDASNLITVDKPPIFLWPMVFCAKLFGLSPFAILLPQILAGLVSGIIIFFILLHRFNFVAAIVGYLTFVTTPLAFAMFRYNNPDALLLLLVLVGYWGILRLYETQQSKYAAIGGVAFGLGFLVKMLAAFIPIPALILLYFLFGAPKLWIKIKHLAYALVGVLVGIAWWLVPAMLIPASQRPYIGGSLNNNVLELAFGYNGLGRIFGNSVKSAATGNVTRNLSTDNIMGITRILFAEDSGQIEWLLIAAIVGGIIFALFTWETRKTSSKFFLVATSALCLISSTLIFSYSEGIFHLYYAMALAPYIAIITGILASYVWQYKSAVAPVRLWKAITLSIIFALGAFRCIAVLNLTHAPQWLITACTITALVFLVCMLIDWRGKAAQRTVLALLIVSLIAPQTFQCIQTVQGTRYGSIVVAGRGISKQYFESSAHKQSAIQGSLVEQPRPTKAMITLLKKDASEYKWAGAVLASQKAAGYQLAIGEPIMALGGFNAIDNVPTMQQFKTIVSKHQLHYFINDPSYVATSPTLESIRRYIMHNYHYTTISKIQFYDLSNPIYGEKWFTK